MGHWQDDDFELAKQADEIIERRRREAKDMTQNLPVNDDVRANYVAYQQNNS